MNRNVKMLCLIFTVSVLLRFLWLGIRPLWIDEVVFINLVNMDLLSCRQEFIPILIHNIISIFSSGYMSEFWIRFQFALAGSLMCLAFYHVIEDKITALFAAAFAAVFPLFVFWSTIARPYIPACLFVILSWKYQCMMIPALLTTPMSIIGINPKVFKYLKQNWMYILCMLLLAIMLFLMRLDHDRGFFNAQFLSTARRIYCIPITCCMLYICVYVVPYIRHRFFTQKTRAHR